MYAQKYLYKLPPMALFNKNPKPKPIVKFVIFII